ncbi:MAG: hypothetical protein IJD60_04305 [Clostridia bacterium]|nr:hypothetical protein [Clostridia bacterium]
MKKLVIALLVALSLFGASALAEDAVSSASVSDSFAQFALTGDDLMNAINTFSGTYVVTTVNPDGTPNAAYFIFSMVKHEGEYYLQLGLAENQSKANLTAGSKGVAVYAANPTGAEGAPAYSVSGARIWFEALEDEALAAQLAANARPGAMFFKITAIRSLG